MSHQDFLITNAWNHILIICPAQFQGWTNNFTSFQGQVLSFHLTSKTLIWNIEASLKIEKNGVQNYPYSKNTEVQKAEIINSKEITILNILYISFDYIDEHCNRNGPFARDQLYWPRLWNYLLLLRLKRTLEPE